MSELKPLVEAVRQTILDHLAAHGPDMRPSEAASAVADALRPSPSISEGEVEAAARAIWNRADDEIGWEQSKRMPDMQPSIEWALDDARSALLAASKARATTEVEVGPLAPFRDLMSELGTSNTFQAGGNEDFQAGAKWMKAQMRARIRSAIAGGE